MERALLRNNNKKSFNQTAKDLFEIVTIELKNELSVNTQNYLHT